MQSNKIVFKTLFFLWIILISSGLKNWAASLDDFIESKDRRGAIDYLEIKEIKIREGAIDLQNFLHHHVYSKSRLESFLLNVINTKDYYLNNKKFLINNNFWNSLQKKSIKKKFIGAVQSSNLELARCLFKELASSTLIKKNAYYAQCHMLFEGLKSIEARYKLKPSKPFNALQKMLVGSQRKRLFTAVATYISYENTLLCDIKWAHLQGFYGNNQNVIIDDAYFSHANRALLNPPEVSAIQSYNNPWWIPAPDSLAYEIPHGESMAQVIALDQGHFPKSGVASGAKIYIKEDSVFKNDLPKDFHPKAVVNYSCGFGFCTENIYCENDHYFFHPYTDNAKKKNWNAPNV